MGKALARVAQRRRWQETAEGVVESDPVTGGRHRSKSIAKRFAL